MNRHLTEAELDALVSGSVSPDAQSHLATCATCTEVLAALRRAELFLGNPEWVTAPPYLRARVMAALPARRSLPLWTIAGGGLVLYGWGIGTASVVFVLLFTLASRVPAVQAVGQVLVSLVRGMVHALWVLLSVLAGSLEMVFFRGWVPLAWFLATVVVLTLWLMLVRRYHRRLFTTS